MKIHQNLEPRRQKALDGLTELLQKFLDRQWTLKEMATGKIAKDSYYINWTPEAERSNNAYIIRYIRWIRYILQGNSIKQANKKENISNWIFYKYRHETYRLYPWAYAILSASEEYCQSIQNHEFIKNIDYRITPTNLVKLIINNYFPEKHQSLFSISEEDYDSIKLDNIRESIMNEIDS